MASDVDGSPSTGNSLSASEILHSDKNHPDSIQDDNGWENQKMKNKGRKRKDPVDSFSSTGFSPEEQRQAMMARNDDGSPLLNESGAGSKYNNPSTNQLKTSVRENCKYDFIIRSRVEICLSTTVSAIKKALPDGSYITRHQLSRNKKVALFKTKNPSPYPNLDLNTILSPNSVASVRKDCGNDSISKHHYDPSLNFKTDKTAKITS
jgi:hypothetical protein